MSVRFSQLNARVESLREHLLPTPFDVTGVYAEAERVQIRARSFVLLSHAELETYFEDRVIEIAKSALKAWTGRGHVSRSTFCLLGFSDQKLEGPPASLDPPGKNKEKEWPELLDITHRFEAAVQRYIHMALNKNHGIKQADLLSLLLPIGFSSTKFDSTLLQEFDAFGSTRGLFAHGGTGHVRQQVDPKTEYDRLISLLNLLRPIDDELDVLLAGAV